MQRRPIPSLFRHGLSAEVRLFIWATLAIVLLVLDSRLRALEPLRQTVATGIYPFQRFVMLPGDAVRQIDDWLNAATLIRQENEALQRQRIEMAQLGTHAAQLAAENAQLRRLLGIADTARQPAVVVQVLYEPPSAFSRRLIFNKGSASGIAPGMPVIDEGGVVGQVVRVTSRTSEAAMVTDEQVSIPVQLLRNGLRLIAFGGNAPGRIEVRYLNANADIREGDMLVTSGLGGLFPPGLPVGRVNTVERDTVSGFARIIGEPLAHPERYRHFLVLRVPVDLHDDGLSAQTRADTPETQHPPPVAQPGQGTPDINKP